MPSALFTNNGFSTLASGITDSATSLTVASGDGALFPTSIGTDYFYCTLIDTSNNLEIVKVTAVSTDTFTVVRGSERTVAQAYSSGDRIELRVTAAGLGETVTSAAASAAAAAADLVLTNADVVTTNADAATTTQDAIDTAADVVLTNADVVSTGNDVTSTNADVVSTNADVVTTNADAATTTQDAIDTAADVVLTNADVVLTNADVVSTGNDVTSTNADVVTTAAYVDTFDDRYLGSKASDPTLDNDGDPLTSGALYYNTTSTVMKVYDLGTTTWISFAAPTALDDLGDVTLTTPSSGQALTYNGSIWVNGSGGGGLFGGNNGATGSSAGDIFRINSATLTANEEIETGLNASCTGPITIDSGVTLTVTGTLAVI